MMRGVSTWAVAVRKPDGEIQVSSEPLVAWANRHRVLRWPVIRGVVALGRVAEDRLPRARHLGQRADRARGGRGGATADRRLHLGRDDRAVADAGDRPLLRGPVGATSLIKDQLGSSVLFWLVEGVLRTAIFIGYLAADQPPQRPAAGLRVPRRGAQDDLLLRGRRPAHSRARRALLAASPALRHQLPAGRHDRRDLRLRPARAPAWYWLLASRILGIPLIAGISYEVIKWAGRNRRKRWVRAIMYPGLLLQNLTTREPDRDQLAVAIASLEAVLAVENPEQARARERHRDRRLAVVERGDLVAAAAVQLGGEAAVTGSWSPPCSGSRHTE